MSAVYVASSFFRPLDALEKLHSSITLRQFGRDCFIERKPEAEDIAAAERGLEKASEIILAEKHELVILDEINIALDLGLISTERVLQILKEKPVQIELVLTGRNAPKEITEVADLVTNMEEVKHYYTRGVQARPGIEF